MSFSTVFSICTYVAKKQLQLLTLQKDCAEPINESVLQLFHQLLDSHGGSSGQPYYGNNEEGDTAMTHDTQYGSPKNIITMYIVKYNKNHFYLD